MQTEFAIALNHQRKQIRGAWEDTNGNMSEGIDVVGMNAHILRAIHIYSSILKSTVASSLHASTDIIASYHNITRFRHIDRSRNDILLEIIILYPSWLN